MRYSVPGLAAHQVTIWTAVLTQAVRRYGVDLEWLREDTTSVYFEGASTDENGQPRAPKGGEAPRLPRVVQGYTVEETQA